MKNELVSVIVSVYNGSKFLKDCFDSILNQDYKNIELIVVNDGSTDKSMSIINKYKLKDNRIKVIDKKNEGVSLSRNKGINASKGQYICIVDQDDVLDNDYISYLYGLINKYNVDISTTYQPFKFNDNDYLSKTDIQDNISVVTGEEAAEKMLYYKLVIAPWNKMISKKLIDKNNICFNKDLFGGEGFKFSIDCFMAADKVAIGNRKIYNYRVDNPTSGMTKFNINVINSSIYAQELMKKEVGKNERMLKACNYSNWHTYCDLYNSFVGCNVISKYKSKYKQIKKVVRHDSLLALTSPISKKEKIKGIIYFINPYIASKIINKLRKRKFTVERK